MLRLLAIWSSVRMVGTIEIDKPGRHRNAISRRLRTLKCRKSGQDAVAAWPVHALSIRLRIRKYEQVGAVKNGSIRARQRCCFTREQDCL